MWWTFVGCGLQLSGVRWDAATRGDAAEDVVVALFALGLQETDGRLLRVTHPAGSGLEILAKPAGGGSVAGWTVESGDADVLRVVGQQETDEGLFLTLQFPGEGQATLTVTDADGEELDQELVEVRQAVDARVLSWEDLRRDLILPLGPVHVVEGEDATFVVQWLASDGEPLAGGGLLTVEGAEALGAAFGFDGTSETLRLSPTAPGSFALTLFADEEEVRTVDVVVHPRDAVDFVSLALGHSTVSAITGAYVEAEVHAVVRVGDAVVSGAELAFDWDGGSAEGDTLTFAADAGPATDVTACFDDVCETFPLPAGVSSVEDREASLSEGCGCGSAAPGGSWAVLAGLLALRRRR